MKKDEEEDSVAKTERESDRRRREEKWQVCWCYRDQQRACRMAQASAENFNILSLLKRKEWLQCNKESSCQVRQAAFTKRKRNRAVCPNYQIMRWEKVKVSESHLREIERVRAGGWGGNSGLHSKERQGRFQEGEGGQARRASLGEVEGSISR